MAVIARYGGGRSTALDCLAITKLDVLEQLDSIQVPAWL